ncbi:MAG TPA: antibiotic biosynthesis monooxygenase [Candidatus Acidoferrales bacterium]|nr:antibiotic biosynthesis monooxygenase [Candidatus Acidoferrales bacterium]
MHARVWQVRIRPGKTDDFKAALQSLYPQAQRQPGYRGGVALTSGTANAPEVTIVAIWNSLDEMRASERNMFVTQAISRVLGCCDGFPEITEREVLDRDWFTGTP